MESIRSSLLNCVDQDTCTKNRLYIAAFAFASLSYVGYVTLSNLTRRRRLMAAIAAKRRQRDEGIAHLKLTLAEGADSAVLARREEIVHLDFEQLRSQLQEGALTAVEALEAFQWKALEAQEKTNFACQFVAEARQWAQELDAKYGGEKKEQKPPLFGIPFSNKECHFLKGYDSTCGFAQFIGQPVDQDNEVVSVLKHAGAVPFVLTNLPMTMWSTGCSNAIFGDTTNPYDSKRTCGGSSGGEGPVIALRGSPLGIGGDIGGSVRTPASFCGICALKPTAGRLGGGPHIRVPASGITGVKPSGGPMGYDVDSLAWFMRAVCAPDSLMFKLDSHVVPLKFDENAFAGKDQKSLTIGYYDHDNFMSASPACRRAVVVARKVLEARGHKLVPVIFPFDVQEMHSLMEAYVAGVFPDGGTQMAELMAKDIVDPTHRYLADFVSQPIWYRKLKSFFTRSPYTRVLLSGVESNTEALRAKYARIDMFKGRFYQFWNRYELDCLICPVVATPALPYEVPPNLFCVYWSYCAIYNLLNYTAGSVHCTKVTSADENAVLDAAQSKRGGLDDDDWLPRLLRECQKGSTNLPVGIQVVTKPFKEELCLRVMKEIETELRKSN